VISSFERVGEESRRGEPTVHYKLTFDSQTVREQLSDQIASGYVLVPEGAPASEEVDVWLDHRGRIREYTKSFPGESRRQFEFWDFGKPGSVGIPSGLQVRESTSTTR